MSPGLRFFSSQNQQDCVQQPRALPRESFMFDADYLFIYLTNLQNNEISPPKPFCVKQSRKVSVSVSTKYN